MLQCIVSIFIRKRFFIQTKKHNYFEYFLLKIYSYYDTLEHKH